LSLPLYVGIWFLAGFLLTIVIGFFVGRSLGYIQGGLISLLIGLVSLLPIIRTERGRHLFFDGPDEDEEGDPLIGCLWLIPAQIILLSILAAVGWIVLYLMSQ
jgi:hypothetical protein